MSASSPRFELGKSLAQVPLPLQGNVEVNRDALPIPANRRHGQELVAVPGRASLHHLAMAGPVPLAETIGFHYREP